ncbi:acyltransferase family protein [Nocardioides panaciterrulae]|uniref:Peptidoglycan/LPS O-acetylase OafA/YrhL n=1 Tax=Nocardioides panaciterrulae TaxID=661492 RepID=A0A7Y9E4Z6_9ACTN|nr:peptidoglycan/LPS O-acetylase OafA/YrhL [Nocardioides panaciterrulae]
MADVIRGYRPDLDGLRTVAVYLVLLFHAGLGWFAGGFIGVDLFFCLSGFLVSSVLLGELLETGNLQVGRFYARRVRRLLPAAVVVVVATCLAFTLLWSVVLRAPVVGDAISALLYYANWHFLQAAGDYFATGIDKSPFLHFWSLSIEEQFYAFFPLLLLLLFKVVPRHRRRPTLLGVVGVLFAASLTLQLVLAPGSTDRAYYGTDTRLYQLLAGALLTIWLSGRTPGARRGVAGAAAGLGMLGILLVGTGVLDLNPSWRGVGAVVASLLLLGGLAHAEGGRLSRMLSVKPMVYLGRISYGTYLWHWPVIVALRTVLDTRPVVLAVLAFGLSTGLAALSFELLEMPVRRWSRLEPFRWRTAVTGVALSALVAAFVVPAILEQDRKPALSAGGGASASLVADADLGQKLQRPVPKADYGALSKQYGDQRFCDASDISACRAVQGSGPTVLLVGDSQAETLVPVFEKLAREHDFSLDLDVLAGCPWQEQLTNAKQSDGSAADCTKARVGWYDKVLPKLDPDVVVLLGRPRDDPAEWGDLVGRRDGKQLPLEQAVWRSTRETVEKVVKVAPAVIVQRLIMPETFNATDCLAGAKKVSQCLVTAQPKPSATDGFATTLAAQDPRVHTLDLNPIFCPTAPVCLPVRDGKVVFRDDHHYTVDYAMSQREQVWKALQATGALDGS